MCDLLERYNKPTFTGYKAALKINGKFRSPATYIEYKVGPVPKYQNLQRFTSSYFINIHPHSFFNPTFNGYTGVFTSRYDAVSLLLSIYEKDRDNYQYDNFVLLKMKLGGILYNGWYVSGPIIAGTEILDIRQLDCELPQRITYV
jgi:hypothetical protein